MLGEVYGESHRAVLSVVCGRNAPARTPLAAHVCHDSRETGVAWESWLGGHRGSRALSPWAAGKRHTAGGKSARLILVRGRIRRRGSSGNHLVGRAERPGMMVGAVPVTATIESHSSSWVKMGLWTPRSRDFATSK